MNWKQAMEWLAMKAQGFDADLGPQDLGVLAHSIQDQSTKWIDGELGKRSTPTDLGRFLLAIVAGEHLDGRDRWEPALEALWALCRREVATGTRPLCIKIDRETKKHLLLGRDRFGYPFYFIDAVHLGPDRFCGVEVEVRRDLSAQDELHGLRQVFSLAQAAETGSWFEPLALRMDELEHARPEGMSKPIYVEDRDDLNLDDLF